MSCFYDVFWSPFGGELCSPGLQLGPHLWATENLSKIRYQKISDIQTALDRHAKEYPTRYRGIFCLIPMYVPNYSMTLFLLFDPKEFLDLIKFLPTIRNTQVIYALQFCRVFFCSFDLYEFGGAQHNNFLFCLVLFN